MAKALNGRIPKSDWDEKKGHADFIMKRMSELGAEYVEIRIEQSDGDSLLINNGNVEAVSFGSDEGLGVRYSINGGIGFFNTNMIEKKEINRLIEKSIRTTRKSSRLSEKIEFSKEKTNKLKYEVKQKKRIGEIDIETKLKYVKGIESELMKSKASVLARTFYYLDSTTNKFYLNSEGTRIESKIPRIDLFYQFTAKENAKNLQRYWQYGVVGGFELIEKMKIEQKIKREADALHENLKNGVRSPVGNLDVIVAPEITGIMAHESVGHPYEADRILGRESAQAGESFLNPNMIGTKIGNSIVNVVDEPNIENSFGFYLYDDEGIKARRKYLIKNGMINELLHNRETAKTFGLQSNGSARATHYGVEPIVRMSNTYVLPGDWKEEEMIKETKYGIYIKNFMEWNIDDKRWNQKYKGNEAYLIENGEITKPIRQPSIEITTPNLWGSVNAIGKKIELHAATCGKGEPMQGIPVTMGGPSMKMKIRIN